MTNYPNNRVGKLMRHRDVSLSGQTVCYFPGLFVVIEGECTYAGEAMYWCRKAAPQGHFAPSFMIDQESIEVMK